MAGPANAADNSTATSAEGTLLLEQLFRPGSLHQVRAAVAAQTAVAGLPPARVGDVVMAVNELVTNAFRHGSGQARLQVRKQDHSLHFHVIDADLAPADDRPQGVPGGESPWPVEPGHGLWLVCRLADQARFEIDGHGSTAAISFTLDGLQQPR